MLLEKIIAAMRSSARTPLQLFTGFHLQRLRKSVVDSVEAADLRQLGALCGQRGHRYRNRRAGRRYPGTRLNVVIRGLLRVCLKLVGIPAMRILSLSIAEPARTESGPLA